MPQRNRRSVTFRAAGFVESFVAGRIDRLPEQLRFAIILLDGRVVIHRYGSLPGTFRIFRYEFQVLHRSWGLPKTEIYSRLCTHALFPIFFVLS